MTADAPGPVPYPDDDIAGLTDAQKSLRAQMLPVGLGLVIGVAALLVALLQGYRIYRRSMSAHTPLRTTPA